MGTNWPQTLMLADLSCPSAFSSVRAPLAAMLPASASMDENMSQVRSMLVPSVPVFWRTPDGEPVGYLAERRIPATHGLRATGGVSIESPRTTDITVQIRQNTGADTTSASAAKGSGKPAAFGLTKAMASGVPPRSRSV